MTINDIVKWVGDYQNVYITGHVHPDGDCVGAALGLQGLLSNYKINAKLLLETPPEVYSFLEGYDEIIDENPEEVDVLFVVDCNDTSRFAPFLESYEKAKVVINIDHHQPPEEYITDKHLIMPSASSTSEMIFHLFPEESSFSKKVAEALYTGIIFDTGGFMHSNTQESTMKAAGVLMASGIDFGFIMKRLFHRQTVKKLAAKKVALDNFRLLAGDKIAFTYINYDEITKNQLMKDDTEDVIHMLATLENTEAAVFASEFQKGTYKLSIRTKKNLDACEIAKVFNGGGHKKAAGGSTNLPLEQLISQIEKEILARL